MNERMAESIRRVILGFSVFSALAFAWVNIQLRDIETKVDSLRSPIVAPCSTDAECEAWEEAEAKRQGW